MGLGPSRSRRVHNRLVHTSYGLQVEDMMEWLVIPLGMVWFLLWAWKGADLLPDVEDPEHDQFRDWT